MKLVAASNRTISAWPTARPMSPQPAVMAANGRYSRTARRVAIGLMLARHFPFTGWPFTGWSGEAGPGPGSPGAGSGKLAGAFGTVDPSHVPLHTARPNSEAFRVQDS